MQKRCGGYTSNGAAGGSYSQAAHLLENNAANFASGKSKCRTCYAEYARDWRAARQVGVVPARRGSRQAPRVPDAIIAKLGPDLDENGAPIIPVQHDHEYRPVPGLVNLWAAVTQHVANGGLPQNLMFLGPSGSGKTDGAYYLAEQAGLPFTKVDAAAITDEESWFGTREIVVEDGVAVTNYKPSAFVLGIESPGVMFIDEITRAKTQLSNIALPLLDGTRQVTNPLTGDVVVRDPRCFVIMAGNRGLQFVGTYAVDPALMTRALVFKFDYQDEANEIAIAVEATGCKEETARVFVKFANESREKNKVDPDILPISTREVINACGLVACGLSADDAVRVTILNGASDEGGAASAASALEAMWAGIRASLAEAAAPVVGCAVVSPSGMTCEKPETHVAVAGDTAHSAVEASGQPITWKTVCGEVNPFNSAEFCQSYPHGNGSHSDSRGSVWS